MYIIFYSNMQLKHTKQMPGVAPKGIGGHPSCILFNDLLVSYMDHMS